MKKKILKRWIAALRSGHYEKGQGQLRDENNKFCVYGVLCNLHAQDHPKIAAKQENIDSYLDAHYTTPSIVDRWAGIPDGGVLVTDPKTGTKIELACLNDSYDFSFKKIANIMEKEFLK